MNRIRKCLFPVAGYGTRFLPATKAIPKEMFPIGRKPLIQYAVEEAISCGISDMVMITSKYKGAIRAHFEPDHEIEASINGSEKEKLLNDLNMIIDTCEFSYVEQHKMLGLGHAISCGEQVIESESFAVVLPDDLCHNEGDSVLSQMIKIHKKYSDCCILAIEEVEENEVSQYGVINGELQIGSENIYKVISLIEKPGQNEAPSNLAIIGRYILTPDIFTILQNVEQDSNGEIQITDALKHLAKRGKVLAYKFEGRRFDCGSPKGFIKATNELAKF